MYCAGLVIRDAVFCLANFDDAFFYLCNPTKLGPQHRQTKLINDLLDTCYDCPSDYDSEKEVILAERG
jgi:hypothetical protein